MGLRLLIILSVIALAEYYSLVVVRSAIKFMPAGWRISLLSSYLLMTALAWLGFIFFRIINWATIPHLLRNIYIAFVIGFTLGKILVLLVMLIDDLRRVVMWLQHFILPSSNSETGSEPNGISRSTFLMQLAMLLAGTSLAGFLYGITNRYSYQVRRIKLKFDSLPQSFKGLRIVQVSDIHTGSFDNHNAVATGIKKTIQENADIVFFTGDLVNNHAFEVDDKYKQLFSSVKAPMGVYSILGNHDYGDYVHWPSKEAKKQNLDDLKKIHSDLGWRLLLNENVVLQRGEDKIAVIGVENWSAKLSFTRYGNMKKAYDGLPFQNVPFKILLSHDPSHWDAEIRPFYPDVQLTLSGHTHGMQFGVDSKLMKWSPIQYVYKKWAGLYSENEQYLYVNRGFGFLGYPGRLGVLPEITVIELV